MFSYIPSEKIEDIKLTERMRSTEKIIFLCLIMNGFPSLQQQFNSRYNLIKYFYLSKHQQKANTFSY